MNNENTKLIGITEESADGNVSYVVFYTLNRMKARADQPEGDIYPNDQNSKSQKFWTLIIGI